MDEWEQIKSQLISKGASPEEITQAQNELFGPVQPAQNPSIEFSQPMSDQLQPSTPVSSLQSVSSRSGARQEFVNPALEEYKKTVEGTAQIKNLIASMDHIRATADELIPAADTIKIGPIESGIMGSVQGLQRTIGNVVLRSEESGLRPWERYVASLGSLLARGFGEKGALQNKDIERVLQWMPKPDDTKEIRDKTFEKIKGYLLEQIKSSNQRLIQIDPNLMAKYNASKDKEKFLENLSDGS